MFDDHHGGVGHIDPDFDHGCRHQNIERRFGFSCEPGHDRVFFLAAHTSVDQPDPVPEPLLQGGVAGRCGGDIDGFGFLHQRADPEHLAAAVDLASHPRDRVIEAIHRCGAGDDRLAAGGLVAQLGFIEVAIGGQHQGSRDRRGGHQQHIDRVALIGQQHALMDPKPVLLINDGKREIM